MEMNSFCVILAYLRIWLINKWQKREWTCKNLSESKFLRHAAKVIHTRSLAITWLILVYIIVYNMIHLPIYLI